MAQTQPAVTSVGVNDLIAGAPVAILTFLVLQSAVDAMKIQNGFVEVGLEATTIATFMLAAKPMAQARRRAEAWMQTRDVALEPQFSARERLAEHLQPRDEGFVGFDGVLIKFARFVQTKKRTSHVVGLFLGIVVLMYGDHTNINYAAEIMGGFVLLLCILDSNMSVVKGWLSRRLRGARYASPHPNRPTVKTVWSIVDPAADTIGGGIYAFGFIMAISPFSRAIMKSSSLIFESITKSPGH